jgi:hypothetical protein
MKRTDVPRGTFCKDMSTVAMYISKIMMAALKTMGLRGGIVTNVRHRADYSAVGFR